MNPGGIATYGWLIRDRQKIVARGMGEIGRGDGPPLATNNLAEYEALRQLIRAIDDLGIRDQIEFISGDSKLVVQQMLGKWRIKSPNIRPIALETAKALGGLKIKWVPREKNEAADELSREAYQISKRHKTGPWSVRYKLNGAENGR